MAQSFRIAFFRGTHKGLPGLYNRAVRLRGHGPYSHVELVFSDGMAASASYMDGGVRFKAGINFGTPDWDVFELPAAWESWARAWFGANAGKAYDLRGNVFLTVGFFSDSPDKFFCSEAAASALGIEQSFRFEPNTLYPVIKRMVQIFNTKQATSCAT